MKRSILLLVANLFIVTLFAQQVISNGEDTGTGWWPAGSAGAVDTWDNPLKDDVNGTNKAMTVWINNGDADYTGGGIGGLSIDVSPYNTISVMIFKQIAGTVRLELQNGTSNFFVTANYTSPGAWQNLKFLIPAGVGTLTTLLVAPHFENYVTNPIPDGEAHRMWWDQVVAYNDTTTGISNAFDSKRQNIVKTEIYSLNGVLIEQLGANEEIPYTRLSRGVFLVKCTDNNGNTSVSKVSVVL